MLSLERADGAHNDQHLLELCERGHPPLRAGSSGWRPLTRSTKCDKHQAGVEVGMPKTGHFLSNPFQMCLVLQK